ncbi:hypothetical protein BS78_02G355100 [Paspalum vaginatum]|nr:hypothetical protein BS78_02G355100 [Paspalum vaginatum]
MADNGANQAANGGDLAAGMAANGGGHAAGVANGGGQAAGMAANGGDQAAGMAANGGVQAAGMVANGAGHAAGMAANGGAHAAGVAANGGGQAAGMAANGPVEVDQALGVPIPGDALRHVLLRLPVAEIARCRTVSRLWRDVPITDLFREYQRLHHGRSMPLFFFIPDHHHHQAAAAPDDDNHVRVNLSAIDIGGRASLPVLRFADHLPNPPLLPAAATDKQQALRIEGSCDGILLLSYIDKLYAFKPGTRRWAHLPPLHDLGDIIGFYARGQDHPRTYRVLFHMDAAAHARRGNADSRYWVMCLSAAGSPVRYIGCPAVPRLLDVEQLHNLELAELRRVVAAGISPSFEMPPVTVGKILYWLPRVRQGNNNNSHVLMFDTGTEHFHSIPPPGLLVQGDQLLEIDGMLAMTRVTLTTVDVWIRNNHPYGMEAVWNWAYEIQLPVAAIQNHMDGHGVTVFVVPQERNVLVQCRRAILQCDAMGHLLQTYQLADNRTRLSRYMFQDNFALHVFLPRLPGDARDGDPPFFQPP